MKPMVLWGCTGQAKVLRECMQGTGWKLVALFDNDEGLKSPFENIPLYFGKAGFESWLSSEARKINVGFLVAIGGHYGRDRVTIQYHLASSGLMPLIARHRTAFVADDCTIGVGSQILAQSAVCAEVQMGCACIVNTGATIDHECRLGDGVHVCPGAHLAGCVQVGDYAMIGTGAAVLPRVAIGEGAIIGAGAVVLRDVPNYSMVVGNPARILRRIEPTEAESR